MPNGEDFVGFLKTVVIELWVPRCGDIDRITFINRKDARTQWQWSTYPTPICEMWDWRLKSDAFTNSFYHGPAASEATKDTKGWHSSVLSQFIVIPERHNKICRHVERHDENHGENWGRDGLEFHDRVFWGETCDHGHPPGLVRPYWGHSSYSLESFFGMTYKCTPTNDGVKSSEYFIIAIF